MSIIKLPLLFGGSKGEKNLYTLFDSGSTYSCINEEVAKGLATLEKVHKPFEVETASEGIYMKIEYAIRLDFYFNELHLSDEFMVIPSLSEDVIIGVNTLQKFRIKLDFDHDTVFIDPKVTKVILKNLI